MIPVQQVVPDALAAVLRKAPLSPEKVTLAWRIAAGTPIDRATTVTLRDGVLYVRARDAAWQREVERGAGIIRTRMDSILGSGVVRELRVTTT